MRKMQYCFEMEFGKTRKLRRSNLKCGEINVALTFALQIVLRSTNLLARFNKQCTIETADSK